MEFIDIERHLKSLSYSDAMRLIDRIVGVKEALTKEIRQEAIDRAIAILEDAGVSLEELGLKTGKKRKQAVNAKFSFIYKGEPYEISSIGRANGKIKGLLSQLGYENKSELIDALKDNKAGAKGITDIKAL